MIMSVCHAILAWSYHFSSIGRISISFVKHLLLCVCRFQYDSAISSAPIFASGGWPCIHSFVFGMSMTPSMIACATCTPCGANSFAMEVESARRANLAQAKADIRALALTLAVAPVKIRVGGYLANLSSACFKSSGRLFCEKMRAPLLLFQVSSNARL